MSGLIYKGYTAEVEFMADDMLLVGRIGGINDIITFEATTVATIEVEFHDAVDDYLETCAKVGKSPDKPYSGNVMLRVEPALHAAAANAARAAGRSLNQFGAEALRRAVA